MSGVMYRFLGLELDAAVPDLRRGGESMAMHATPLRLLVHLVRERHRALSRQELLDAVWPGVTVSESALSTALKEVRRALGDDGTSQSSVRTLRGRGYRFVAPVEEVPASGASPSRDRSGPAAESEEADFVGREVLLRRLVEGLDSLGDGRGRLVLLAGEPGIGKTRSATRLAAIARTRGLAPQFAWCPQGGEAEPLWPWRRLLRGVLAEPASAGVLERSGAWGIDLCRILPELSDQVAALVPAAPLDEETRLRIFEAATAVLQATAPPSGRLLVLDDLQWSDTASLLLLEFLGHAIADEPLMVLCTCRSSEADWGEPFRVTFAKLSGLSAFEHHELRGLGASEVRTLASRVARGALSEALLERIVCSTDGNPYFVRELAREWASKGAEAGRLPFGLRSFLRARLHHLPDPTVDSLALGATLGERFPLSLVARASDLAPTEVARHLEPACAAGAIEELSPGEYRFRHSLQRETVYRDQSAAERLERHRRIAMALDERCGRQPGEHLAALAHHHAQAVLADSSLSARALELSRQAAERAMEQVAFEAAAEHYAIALRILDGMSAAPPRERLPLLTARADALWRAGDLDAARSGYRELADLARALGDAESLGRAAIGYMGWLSTRSQVDPTGRGMLEQALGALEDEPSALRVHLLTLLASQLWMAGERERAETLRSEAERLADQLDVPEVHALVLRAQHDMGGVEAPPAERLDLANRSLRDAVDPLAVGSARLYRIIALLQLGDRLGAEAEEHKLDDHVRRHAIRELQPHVARLAVLRPFLEGHFDEAERRIQQAWELAETCGDPLSDALGFSQRWWLAHMRGRLSELAPATRERAAQQPHLIRMFYAPLALAELEAGRIVAARAAFASLAKRGLTHLARGQGGIPSLAAAVEVAVRLPERDVARILYDLMQPYAGTFLVATYACVCLGPAEHLLGQLAALLQRWSDAERHFVGALEASERIRASTCLAHTQASYAAMLLARDRRGDRARAAGMAAQAFDTARELGMGGLERRVRPVLEHASGVVSLGARRRRRS